MKGGKSLQLNEGFSDDGAGIGSGFCKKVSVVKSWEGMGGVVINVTSERMRGTVPPVTKGNPLHLYPTALPTPQASPLGKKRPNKALSARNQLSLT